MDEDLVVGLLFIILFLTFPFLLIVSILSCIAYSRTRAWKKEQLRLRSADNEPLVTPEEEEDFLDTDDEEEHRKHKDEELADRNLTTRQKFRKEFGKAWRGNGVKDVAKQREREERRKLAKAVAREIERRERRRERESRLAGSSADGDLLPRYEATVGDRKQAGGQ